MDSRVNTPNRTENCLPQWSRLAVQLTLQRINMQVETLASSLDELKQHLSVTDPSYAPDNASSSGLANSNISIPGSIYSNNEVPYIAEHQLDLIQPSDIQQQDIFTGNTRSSHPCFDDKALTLDDILETLPSVGSCTGNNTCCSEQNTRQFPVQQEQAMTGIERAREYIHPSAWLATGASRLALSPVIPIILPDVNAALFGNCSCSSLTTYKNRCGKRRRRSPVNYDPTDYCEQCNKPFSRRDAKLRHMRTVHKPTYFLP
ncbi:hypothetical protein EC973_000028 [Apophysomyces ossiformis]|uniref:C2H2-type domain-containing protein n=1 Tax=Apophysomyces ossiformis TaxID=679940 RepID=A0A8H7BWG4_9FUNG|nr:hypothetical protein EC973_000028 [Apophysomyces ossiformis]